MTTLTPISPDQASEEVAEVYQRIKDTIGDGEVPPAFQLLAGSQPLLQDCFMNYRKFVAEGAGKLEARQRRAVTLAVAWHAGSRPLIDLEQAGALAAGWSEQQLSSIGAVAAACAVYNTYFKFKDLAGDDAFASMSVGLRAHTFKKAGLEDADVELINIAISNINGCPMCTAGHVKKARDLGVTNEQIDEAIKAAATIVGMAAYLQNRA